MTAWVHIIMYCNSIIDRIIIATDIIPAQAHQHKAMTLSGSLEFTLVVQAKWLQDDGYHGSNGLYHTELKHHLLIHLQETHGVAHTHTTARPSHTTPPSGSKWIESSFKDLYTHNSNVSGQYCVEGF